MADTPGLAELFNNMREQLALLAFSGVGGAFFRAFLAPEKQWKRRVVRHLSGRCAGPYHHDNPGIGRSPKPFTYATEGT